MIKPTENELEIIHKLRTLQPFEKVEIVADKQGQPNTFMVVRSRTEKILFTNNDDPQYFV